MWPFSAVGLTILALRRFVNRRKLKPMKLEEIFQLIPSNLSSIFFIEPDVSWLTKTAQQQFESLKTMNSTDNADHFLKIHGGDGVSEAKRPLFLVIYCVS